MKQLVVVLALILVSKAQAQNETVVAPQNNSPVATGSPIYIMNSQSQSSSQNSSQNAAQKTAQTQAKISEQPASVIEDSPLTLSPAEIKRRKRQEMEVRTEQTIVEKLEEARMEEEKMRVQRLFGNKNSFSSEQQVQNTQNVQVIQGQIQEKQQEPLPITQQGGPIQKQDIVIKEVVREVPVAPTKDDTSVREEIRAAIRDLKEKEQPEVQNRMFVSGGIGTANYPGVINMRGSLSTGVQIGVENTANRTILEAGFIYSSLLIESVDFYSPFPAFKDLKQYNISAAGKIALTSGLFRPIVGAGLSYTRRTYSDRQYAYMSTGEVSTDAVDFGLIGGLEVGVNQNIAIGLDIRYMMNIGYRDDSSYMQSFVNPQPGAVVEKRNYMTSLLTARVNF